MSITARSQWPWPQCGVCCRPVAEFSIRRCHYQRAFIFRARCHGAVEECTLDDHGLSLLSGPESISQGVAFAAPQLEILP